MMKRVSILLVSAWLLITTAACAIAQQFEMPTVRITVEARVRDPDGRPVDGATVNLTLPRYAEGEKYQMSSAVTNRDGVAVVSGMAQQDYLVTVKKAGFYPTRGPFRDIADEKSIAQYGVGVQNVELELRPVRNPVQRPILRWVDGLRVPAFHQPLGFDLEAGDWVAPHGSGRTSDLIFAVEGHFRSLQDYDQTLTLSFSRPGDGIQVWKYPKNVGPAFKFPYEAPESGYESRRTWRTMFDGKTRHVDFDMTDEANYIFRVRTELDDKGRVRRALYGVIEGEIRLTGNHMIGRYLNFVYKLNPNSTPNIEFDPAVVPRPMR